MQEDLGFWDGILDVARGRGQLRLFLQPLMAILLGIRLGIADAKEGQEPFLLRLFRRSQGRKQLAKQAALDVLIPFGLAIVIDGVLQYLAHGFVRPAAAIVVGIILIWLPFSIARALTNRVYRHSARGRKATAA